MTESQSQEAAADMLERLAFQHVAGIAKTGIDHASRIAYVSQDEWQTALLRRSSAVKVVSSHDQLAEAMDCRDVAAVMVLSEAGIDQKALERVCRDSPFGKMIICEIS